MLTICQHYIAAVTWSKHATYQSVAV